jgi:hypothetical protein
MSPALLLASITSKPSEFQQFVLITLLPALCMALAESDPTVQLASPWSKL